MSPRTLLLAGAVALAGLTAGGVALRDHYATALAGAQAVALHASQDAQRERSHAAASDSLARALDDTARTARHAADSLATVAASRDAAARAAVAHLRALAALAPDTCRTVVLAAGDAVAADSAARAPLVQRADSLQDALRTTIASRDSLRVALGGLSAATGRLEGATTVLVHASRPSLLAKLTPRPGFGLAAGIDPLDRAPRLVIGVTLSWSR